MIDFCQKCHIVWDSCISTGIWFLCCIWCRISWFWIAAACTLWFLLQLCCWKFFGAGAIAFGNQCFTPTTKSIRLKKANLMCSSNLSTICNSNWGNSSQYSFFTMNRENINHDTLLKGVHKKLQTVLFVLECQSYQSLLLVVAAINQGSLRRTQNSLLYRVMSKAYRVVQHPTGQHFSNHPSMVNPMHRQKWAWSILWRKQK